MKYNVHCSLFVGLCSLLFISTTHSQDTLIPPPYQTLKITYNTTPLTNKEKGDRAFSKEETQVNYIDVKNNKKRIEKKIKLLASNVDMKRTLITITDANGSFFIYPDLKEVREFHRGPMEADPIWVDVILQEKYFEAESDYLGFPCKIYKQNNVRYWLWHNIILKREEFENNRVLRAVRIDPNIKLESDLFIPPKNYRYVDSKLYQD